MEDSRQVTGDAPRPVGVKRRNQKSATADVLKGLLSVMSVLLNEHHLDIPEQRAAVLELIRRIHGHP